MDDDRDPHILAMPGASDGYVAARERLRLAERALTEQREAVAAQRRALPPGPAVEEYTFDDVRGGTAHLSELFAGGTSELVIYHLMYWEDDDEFCPMCSLWIDGLDAVEPHVSERASVVVATSASVDALRDWAARRGWRRVRLLSNRGPGFARATGAADADGRPDSTVPVFAKDGDGVRHVYTGRPFIAGEQRNIDLLCPVWHVFDLLPSGRGDWSASNDVTLER